MNEESLRRENEQLRRRIDALLAEASKNEAILRRSQRRELELLGAGSLAALLRLLVEGMQHSFRLSAVTLVLLDPEHELRHLLAREQPAQQSLRGLRFVGDLGAAAPVYRSLRRVWLGPYTASEHAGLFAAADTPRSLALLPLLRRERVVGCLNLGSADAGRFTGTHATDFLQHLADIAALSLENAVNRARLVLSGMTDALTGWHNRRYLQTRLEEELARAQRSETPLACLLLDVDHFKRINDEHGHLCGDGVLRWLAARIEVQVRASDVTARYGGEEFAILLPATARAEAERLAERVRKAVVGQPCRTVEAGDLPVTISIGGACIVPARELRELHAVGQMLFAAADEALYRAKQAGRNCVRWEALDPSPCR